MADGQQIMADQIQSKEDIEMMEMFKIFDVDNSGAISQDELKNVIRGLGQNPTDVELEDMIKAVDKNDNGMIEFDEFKKMYAKKSKTKEESKDELMEAFRKFAGDDNEYISKEALTKALENVTSNKEEIEEMFSSADVNSDGKISYKEFVTLWTA